MRSFAAAGELLVQIVASAFLLLLTKEILHKSRDRQGRKMLWGKGAVDVILSGMNCILLGNVQEESELKAQGLPFTLAHVCDPAKAMLKCLNCIRDMFLDEELHEYEAKGLFVVPQA
jgi:hypothetical protein